MRYLKKEVIFKKDELAKLDGERKDLENKVNLIYDESIDKDYLDELARRSFGLINEDEICISDNNKIK